MRVAASIPRFAARRAAASAALVAVLAVAGCASSPEDLSERDQLNLTLKARGLDPETVIVPYELTPEMIAWVHDTVAENQSPESKLRRLSERLLDDDALSVEYVWGYTGTAVEVFEQHRANCLSFTNLFVGMARELGVPVFFLEIEDVETYRKEGDLVVVSDHIAVGYETGPDALILDFSEEGLKESDGAHPISDLTAIAMYYTNRGAEALQTAEISESLDWLRTAVLLDPYLAHAWVNLGVGLRRSGDPQGAEDAYRKALEIDARTPSAYQNLAALLSMEERVDEAREYELALQRSPSRNPYTYLSLGDISRRNGRLAEAQRLYRRAIALGCEVAECYAAFGQLALAEGKVRTARRMLEKARKIDPENPRTQQLAAQLRSDLGRKP
jgi:Flp pilus assembly protein TadD